MPRKGHTYREEVVLMLHYIYQLTDVLDDILLREILKKIIIHKYIQNKYKIKYGYRTHFKQNF